MDIVVAKNSGRINVWPDSVIARQADTNASKRIGRINVWPSKQAAENNQIFVDNLLKLANGAYVVTSADVYSYVTVVAE